MTAKALKRRLSRIHPRHSHTPDIFLSHAGRRDAKKDYVKKDTYGSYTSEWIRERGKYLEDATHRVFALCSGPVQEERARRISWLEKQTELIKKRDELAPKLQDMRNLRGNEHRAQRLLREEMARIEKQLTTIAEELPKMEGKIREIEFLAENRAAQIRKVTEAQIMVYLRGARRDLDEQATIDIISEDRAEELYRKYFAEI